MNKTRAELNALWITDYVPSQGDFSNLWDSFLKPEDTLTAGAIEAPTISSSGRILRDLSGIPSLDWGGRVATSAVDGVPRMSWSDYLRFYNNVYFQGLTGSGTRMLTVGSDGLVGAAAIPSGGGLSGLSVNYIPIATSSSAIGNSDIKRDATYNNYGFGETYMPYHKIAVNGGLSVKGGVHNLSPAFAAITLTNDGSTGQIQSWGSTPLVLQGQGSSVIIGDFTPSSDALLKVGGNIQSAGNFIVPSGSNLYLKTGSIIGAKVDGITGALTLPYLSGSGTRMLTADASGNVSSAAVPTGWGYSAVVLTGSEVIGSYNAQPFTIVTNNTPVASFNAAGGLALSMGATSASYGVAMGPYSNSTRGFAMAIGGYALASGFGSMALGQNSIASDVGTMAIGYSAHSTHSGAMVLSDSTAVNSENVQQFKAGFLNGYKFYLTDTTPAFEIFSSGKISMYNVPSYASEAAAIAAEPSNRLFKVGNAVFITP